MQFPHYLEVRGTEAVPFLLAHDGAMNRSAELRQDGQQPINLHDISFKFWVLALSQRVLGWTLFFKHMVERTNSYRTAFVDLKTMFSFRNV